MTDKELQEIRDWMGKPPFNTVEEDMAIFGEKVIPKLLDEIDRIKAKLAIATEYREEIAERANKKHEKYVVACVAQVHFLEIEIERIKAERTWISVKDRLPEEKDWVIGLYEPQAHKTDNIAEARGTEFRFSPCAFTHWMPLPAPPK